MYWSFSEYLNLIELRSQTWCVFDMSASGGFRIPHSEAIFFYAVVEGSARLSCGGAEPVIVEAGEIVIVLSGEAHAMRISPDSNVEVPQFLNSGEIADGAINQAIGKGPVATRMLCGRLKPRWPAGRRPPGLPTLLRTCAARSHIDLAGMIEAAKGSGGAAVLTKLAMLVFVTALKDHPASQDIFRESSLRAPIAQAVQLIETHPFRDWTVEILARKVGMGRSNFAACFADSVGKTPMAFVVEERMKLATMFLEQTDLKIAEIAERTGYRSQSAFSHRFTAHMGATPAEIRDRAKAVARGRA